MAAKLKSIDGFDDPTNLNASTLENIGSLAKGLGKNYLKDLPPTAVAGAVDTLGTVEFKKSEVRKH